MFTGLRAQVKASDGRARALQTMDLRRGVELPWFIGLREKAPHFAMLCLGHEPDGWTSLDSRERDHDVMMLGEGAECFSAIMRWEYPSLILCISHTVNPTSTRMSGTSRWLCCA